MTDLNSRPRYRVRPHDAQGIREFYTRHAAWTYYQTVIFEGRKATFITDAS